MPKTGNLRKLKIDIGRILRILSERKRVIIEEADCVQIIYSYVGEYPPEFEFDKLGKLKALSLEITLDVDQYVVLDVDQYVVEVTTSSDDLSYFLLVWNVATILQHFLFCKW